MKHVIIGTAGHVDHGKTMLIKALTGIDTDRLMEEEKSGASPSSSALPIWTLTTVTQAGIIDVPGHEKFIKNMLAGAGGIDLAMLVVAADEGFMPQTVEHLDILHPAGHPGRCGGHHQDRIWWTRSGWKSSGRTSPPTSRGHF